MIAFAGLGAAGFLWLTGPAPTEKSVVDTPSEANSENKVTDKKSVRLRRLALREPSYLTVLPSDPEPSTATPAQPAVAGKKPASQPERLSKPVPAPPEPGATAPPEVAQAPARAPLASRPQASESPPPEKPPEERPAAETATPATPPQNAPDEQREKNLELRYATETRSRDTVRKREEAEGEVLETVRFRRVIPESAGLLKSGETIIHLAGVDALPANAECKTASGESWPCGNYAAFALRRLIRGRSVVCDILKRSSETVLTGNCKVVAVDMNKWVVRHGWARPTGDTAQRYAHAFKAAQEEKKGQWRDGLSASN